MAELFVQALEASLLLAVVRPHFAAIPQIDSPLMTKQRRWTQLPSSKKRPPVYRHCGRHIVPETGAEYIPSASFRR